MDWESPSLRQRFAVRDAGASRLGGVGGSWFAMSALGGVGVFPRLAVWAFSGVAFRAWGVSAVRGSRCRRLAESAFFRAWRFAFSGVGVSCASPLGGCRRLALGRLAVWATSGVGD